MQLFYVLVSALFFLHISIVLLGSWFFFQGLLLFFSFLIKFFTAFDSTRNSTIRHAKYSLLVLLNVEKICQSPVFIYLQFRFIWSFHLSFKCCFCLKPYLYLTFVIELSRSVFVAFFFALISFLGFFRLSYTALVL